MSSVRFNDNDYLEAMTQRSHSAKFQVGALSTYEALVSGGDKKKEILLRRGKGNVDKIMADIVREMVQQKLASIHYEAMSNYVLFLPTMLITLSSAALSIIATSDLIEDSKVKTKLTILVAFLQLCLATLQSLSKQLDFGARAGFHRSAARTLQKIHQNAKHRQYESRYQSIFRALKQNKRLSIGFNVLEGDIEAESSDSDSDDESIIHSTHDQPTQNGLAPVAEDPPRPPSPPPPPKVEHENHEEEDHPKKRNGKNQVSQADSLGKQFKQAVEQVESIVPPRISNAFNVLEARIRVQNESLLTNKNNSLVAWEQVLPALYFQLSETIIESTGWPFLIPLPSKSVEKTLKSFKNALSVDKKDNADLLMDILDRSTDIFTVQKRLAKKREEKEMKRRATEMKGQMNGHHMQQAIKELEKEITFDDDSHQWANESQPLISHAV